MSEPSPDPSAGADRSTAAAAPGVPPPGQVAAADPRDRPDHRTAARRRRPPTGRRARGCRWAGSSPNNWPTRHPAGCAGWCWPPPGPAYPGWAGYPARHAPCWPWRTAAATSHRSTTGGSPATCTAAPPAPTPTRYCALPWLARLRHPTLVLAGDDDPLVPALNGRILAHRIPDSRLHIVAGGGHLFLLERPVDMARQVADFLHRNPDDTHPTTPINDENEQDRGPR